MPFRRLLALFFVSGASGLIYQVVWMRALALTLSVTVYAVTTVLCAFMGGLALGAAIAGRMADRLERPLLVFGLAEVARYFIAGDVHWNAAGHELVADNISPLLKLVPASSR